MSSTPDSPLPEAASLATQPPHNAKTSPITVPILDTGSSSSGPQKPMPCTVQEATEEQDDEPESFTNGAAKNDDHPAEANGIDGQKKKRKKRKKAATAMARNRGTGFEEFYADPPVTPHEALEEQAIYSPQRPFEDRIEECLNRFRGRRRLQGELTRYFNEYLFLGGIDSSQCTFQGVDPKEYAAASAEEKQQLANVYGILSVGDSPKFYSPTRPENWSVDFSAVVAGYLSDEVPRLTWVKPRAETEMQRAIDVVANFLRYLLQHDVCNEYKDDVTNALGICARAKKELPLIQKAIGKANCQFNEATARVFKDNKTFEYVQQYPRKDPLTTDEGIFALGVVFFGPRVVYHQMKSLKVVHTVGVGEACSLEILSVHPLDDMARDAGKLYGQISKVGDGIHTGIIRCKHVFIRDDLCRGDAAEEVPDRVEELMIEEGLLGFLRPGCIIRVTLAELNIGLKYMTNLPQILPSFYRFLPQMMMRRYKPPRRNERPAPSALDPAGGTTRMRRSK